MKLRIMMPSVKYLGQRRNMIDATEVFAYPDDMKLKSCMTLFKLADPEQKLFGAVLDKFFDGERDENTITILKNKFFKPTSR